MVGQCQWLYVLWDIEFSAIILLWAVHPRHSQVAVPYIPLFSTVISPTIELNPIMMTSSKGNIFCVTGPL